MAPITTVSAVPNILGLSRTGGGHRQGDVAGDTRRQPIPSSALVSFSVKLLDARVLVTGASGFIGSHLTRRLLTEGAEVHVLTSAVSRLFPTRLIDIRDMSCSTRRTL